MWKFKAFSATQILREINFRVLKSAILKSVALRALKILVIDVFVLLKLISRKISKVENFQKKTSQHGKKKNSLSLYVRENIWKCDL